MHNASRYNNLHALSKDHFNFAQKIFASFSIHNRISMNDSLFFSSYNEEGEFNLKKYK